LDTPVPNRGGFKALKAFQPKGYKGDMWEDVWMSLMREKPTVRTRCLDHEVTKRVSESIALNEKSGDHQSHAQHLDLGVTVGYCTKFTAILLV